jgi:hypothetical protein
MISLHMQGGCLCENPPGLRLETTNVEIAGTIAPRPLLMVSATGDWTAETMEKEYPAVRSVYGLYGAEDRVHAVRITADHNYNKDSREAMYAWMARWLQQAPPDVRRPEQSFSVDPLQDLMVFFKRPLPDGAVTPVDLTNRWIEAAQGQLRASAPATAIALRHVLGFAQEGAVSSSQGTVSSERIVLTATRDAETSARLTKAGFRAVPIAFTPFDAKAAASVRHFETYNRTAASQRVADIVSAIRAHPGAALVADGDAALAAMLAVAIVRVSTAVLDVDQFDRSNDDGFLDRLFIPGLRRAGDLQTAAAMARGTVVVHNAGSRFGVTGVDVRSGKLSGTEIVELIKKARKSG